MQGLNGKCGDAGATNRYRRQRIGKRAVMKQLNLLHGAS